MTRLLVSLTVTDLDSYRRYRDNDEMSLQELLRRLHRLDPPSDAMRAGTALHSLLEAPQTGSLSSAEISSAEIDGHHFTFSLDASLPLLPFRELHGKRIYEVNGEEIEVRGKVDTFDGFAVEDHKLTQSTFDAERYFTSYQWRLYLSLFNARKFRYNVFTGKFLNVDEAGLQCWEITDFQRLELCRYPELEDDITRELEEYAEFAHHHLLNEKER